MDLTYAEHFRYDESSPTCLVHAFDKGNHRKPDLYPEGSPAGYFRKDGHALLCVGRSKRHYASQVVWALCTGEILGKDKVIWFKDLNKSNLRIDNLIAVDRSTSQLLSSYYRMNTGGSYANRNGRYSARVKDKQVGSYDTKQEACEAHKAAIKTIITERGYGELV